MPEGSLSFTQALSSAGKLIRSDRRFIPANRPILKAGKKAAPASVLMLHGFSASPYECADLAKDLASRGYAVFVPRIAGHGGNRQEFESSGLAAWMESAEQGFRIARGLGRKLFVIGQSGGGVLAALLAERHPGEISALVLAAPAFRLANPAAPLTRFAWLRFFIPQVVFPADQPDLAAHWNLSYDTTMVAELVRAGRLASQSALRLKMPLGLVQADRDTVVSASYNARLFKSIPSAHKRIWMYRSWEHNVLHHHNERQTEVFEWIRDFLKTGSK